MNLTTLRYFVAVAQYGSISKAAEKLYITQPALSRHIQRLEDELGVPLIDKKNESGLTESGKICLKLAKDLLYQADQLYASANAIRKGETGSLAIGYCGGERHFLFLFIKEIRKRYPNIEITFQKNVSDKFLVDALAEQKLDFIFGGADFKHPDISSVPIQKGHMQLMVSQDHPLAGKGTIRLEDLREAEFVMWKREFIPVFYDGFVALCRSSGFEPKILKFEHVDSESFFSSILASDAVGVIVSGMRIMADEKLFSFLDMIPRGGVQVPEEPRVLSYNHSSKNPCVELVVQTVLPDYMNGLGSWK